jgi:hypothetical protein
MLKKRTIGRAFGVCLALIYGSLIATGVWDLWSRIGVWPSVIILVLLGVGLYRVGVWISVDRPAELNRKIPISSKELRRRTKEFYDWLAAQGNQRPR